MIPHPLKILCIGDTRPGHEKQTRAMVEAFAGITSVETRWFHVPQARPFAFFSYILALQIKLCSPLSPRILKNLGWQEDGFSPDLIIATGSHTHGALLIFGKHYRAKTLVCMTPDAWVRRQVDLVLSPQHDGKKADAHTLLTLGPPCRTFSRERRKADQGLILVGGLDPASHIWDSGALKKDLEDLLMATPKMRWELSSSPRTPKETEDMLAHLCDIYPAATFIPFSRTPAGWVEDAYAQSSEAWITADSMSMIYEALSAGCRVGVLPVRWRKKGNKFQRSLDLLHGKGWIFYPGEEKKEMTEALNEAGRAAKEAVKRWWNQT